MIPLEENEKKLELCVEYKIKNRSEFEKKGEGSYSVIWLWKKENVIVKRYLPPKACPSVPKDDPFNLNDEKLAKREYNILNKLKDEKYIVKLLEFVKFEEVICGILLEYCENGDVSNIIKIGETKIDMKLKWMLQTSKAVRNIQKYGIVHCDLKCSNLLLDRNYDIKLCDFHGYTTNGGEPGVWNRITSPLEFIKDRKATFKSDNYSLGVTFIEMLRLEKGYKYPEKEKIPENVILTLEENIIMTIKNAGKDKNAFMIYVESLNFESLGHPIELKRLILECLIENPDNRPDVGYIISELETLVYS